MNLNFERPSPHGQAVRSRASQHEALGAEADGGRDDIAAVRGRLLPGRAELLHPRHHTPQHRIRSPCAHIELTIVLASLHLITSLENCRMAACLL